MYGRRYAWQLRFLLYLLALITKLIVEFFLMKYVYNQIESVIFAFAHILVYIKSCSILYTCLFCTHTWLIANILNAIFQIVQIHIFTHSLIIF